MTGNRFSVQDRVRWSDVDNAGIIYFGSYIRFFEIAETEMYRAMGLPYSRAFETLNVYPVRAQFHCDFKSPAYLDDLVTVELWVSHIGTSSIIFKFALTRALSDRGTLGETLMTGHCIMVTVDRENFKPRRVPQQLRESMAPYTIIEDQAELPV